MICYHAVHIKILVGAKERAGGWKGVTCPAPAQEQVVEAATG